jgi:hypothetical protein
MTQIRPIAIIQQRARQAFEKGQGRDSHCLPPCEELEVWLAEYDLRTAEQAQERRWAASELAEVSPP